MSNRAPRRPASLACAGCLVLAGLFASPARPAAPDPIAAFQQELERGTKLAASSPATALQHYKRAYALAHATGLDSMEAVSLLRIGQVELGRDGARARIVLHAALPLWRARGDSSGVARTLAALAEAERRDGRPDQAVALLEQAAQAARQPREQARLWLQCAAIDKDLDDALARGRHLERAARAAQDSRDPGLAALAAAARARQLYLQRALPSAEAMLTGAGGGGDVAPLPPRARAALLLAHADLNSETGWYAAAARDLDQAEPLSSADSTGEIRLALLERRGALAWTGGDSDSAATIYLALRAAARAAGANDIAARAALALGRIELHSSNPAGARTWAGAVAGHGAAAAPSIALGATLLHGLASLADHRTASARVELTRARLEALRLGEPEMEAAADQALGDAETLDARPDAAFRWYARAAAALSRAETARWMQDGPRVPAWVASDGLLRRRLNVALMEPNPARGWQLQEDARAAALLRALEGPGAARLRLWTPQERALASALAVELAASRARPPAGEDGWLPLVRAADSLQSAVDARLLAARHLRPAAVSEVQRALRPGEALLTYSLAADGACVWIATHDSLVRVDLGPSLDLVPACRLASRGSDSSAAMLRDRLARPVEPRLPPGLTRLVLVPDPEMVTVPSSLPWSIPPQANPAAGTAGAAEPARAVAASAGSWAWLSTRPAARTGRSSWVGVAPGSLSPVSEGNGTPEAPDSAGPGPDWFRAGAGGRAVGTPVRIAQRAGCTVLLGPAAARATGGNHAGGAMAESPGLAALARAHAALETGVSVVAVQVGGPPPSGPPGAAPGRGDADPTSAWMSAFHSRLQAGASAARAAAAADSAAPGPAFLVLGSAFESVRLAPELRVVPWVGAVALATLALVVIVLLAGAARGRRE
ncbi:MAG: hypothetical protein HZB25_07080 [Candidatus Eisenbacteria bacterium]|nr:hypothetical protein [Candidatus Eisenbacteria bacterium]